MVNVVVHDKDVDNVMISRDMYLTEALYSQWDSACSQGRRNGGVGVGGWPTRKSTRSARDAPPPSAPSKTLILSAPSKLWYGQEWSVNVMVCILYLPNKMSTSLAHYWAYQNLEGV